MIVHTKVRFNSLINNFQTNLVDHTNKKGFLRKFLSRKKFPILKCENFKYTLCMGNMFELVSCSYNNYRKCSNEENKMLYIKQ